MGAAVLWGCGKVSGEVCLWGCGKTVVPNLIIHFTGFNKEKDVAFSRSKFALSDGVL